jgi:hypothetical protein
VVCGGNRFRLYLDVALGVLRQVELHMVAGRYVDSHLVRMTVALGNDDVEAAVVVPVDVEGYVPLAVRVDDVGLGRVLAQPLDLLARMPRRTALLVPRRCPGT